MFHLSNMFSLAALCGIVGSLPLAAAAGGYEVWASDQSNSVPGQTALGVKGSFLWIFDSEKIEEQLNGGEDAVSEPCTPDATQGPCDIFDVFPEGLLGFPKDKRGGTAGKLRDLEGFGRLHGVISDPQQKYVVANMFTPRGGYVGIIDTRTKEAVGLFRVTKFEYDAAPGGPRRSVHMSFWDQNGGKYILIDNLHGKAIERINVIRDENDDIVDLQFDQSATIGLGKNMVVAEPALFFQGKNAFKNKLIGSVIGDYADADLGDLTPNNVCKENGCSSGDGNGAMGGRGNNLPICPITSANDFLYITLAGGGMFVADITTTPMKIVAEYGNNVVYGAGCGGVQSGDQMFMNSGVSASGAGATQSMFAVWSFDDPAYAAYSLAPFAENQPMPTLIYQDEETNTLTGGNLDGPGVSNLSGQIPGETTRRDSHGVDTTVDGFYLHVVDRIQNIMEVFDVNTHARFTPYDLTSASGKDGRTGIPGACAAKSVMDDSGLPSNDPAPDLFEHTPDGKYLMVALRGPAPVSVSHGAQGSCPGVGVVELTEGGTSGKLVAVLRTTNTVPDQVATVSAPGGYAYAGSERSDVHGAIVVAK